MNPGWCPGENNGVTYLSNDPEALASRVAGYQMHDGTGTNVAMNYGLMLLDPSTRLLVQQAATGGWFRLPSQIGQPTTTMARLSR